VVQPITFEYPINERNRTLLRLEHLFLLLQFHTRSESKAASRSCITHLLEISQVLGRADIKSELIKELERQIKTLSVIRDTPGIDLSHLDAILKKLTYAHKMLYQTQSQLGKEIREDEFMKSINQRSSIPGGSCAFDLPRYHLWLHQPAEQRKKDIKKWRKTLLPASNAIAILLKLIRESITPSNETAKQGFFRQSLDSQSPVQIIRVSLPCDLAIYAEISGSKHLFNISFMDKTNPAHIIQTKNDINFQLTVCTL
jgi:cell division protein ZapD